jgi:hypothetical protein
MAKLNLNFIQKSGRYEPTKNEIYQLEGLALSIGAIIKTLNVYANENSGSGDLGSVCMSVCNALEILIDPITEYMGDCAGSPASPKEN